MPKGSTRIRKDRVKEMTTPGKTPNVTVAGSGAAGMRDATVRMKQVVGGGSVLRQLGAEGKKTEVAMLQKLEETDGNESSRRTDVPLEVEKAAIVEYAAGGSPSAIAVKYDVQQDFVRHALKRRFGSFEAGKRALQGLVMENALACQVQAAQHIHEMSGPQAVMSGAILIDKMIAIEKSIQETPKTINFGALAEIGADLKALREIVPRADKNSTQG
jgi:hypothetical protein